jgi:hypothetical protein
MQKVLAIVLLRSIELGSSLSNAFGSDNYGRAQLMSSNMVFFRRYPSNFKFHAADHCSIWIGHAHTQLRLKGGEGESSSPRIASNERDLTLREPPKPVNMQDTHAQSGVISPAEYRRKKRLSSHGQSARKGGDFWTPHCRRSLHGYLLSDELNALPPLRNFPLPSLCRLKAATLACFALTSCCAQAQPRIQSAVPILIAASTATPPPPNSLPPLRRRHGLGRRPFLLGTRAGGTAGRMRVGPL